MGENGVIAGTDVDIFCKGQNTEKAGEAAAGGQDW